MSSCNDLGNMSCASDSFLPTRSGATVSSTSVLVVVVGAPEPGCGSCLAVEPGGTPGESASEEAASGRRTTYAPPAPIARVSTTTTTGSKRLRLRLEGVVAGDGRTTWPLDGIAV